jgi:DNA polymerase-3 subunit alpha
LKLGGVITSVDRKFTRKGAQMAILKIEDLQGSIEVTVFPKTYEKFGHLIEEDKIVLVRGRLDRRDESLIAFNAQEIQIVEPMRASDLSVHIDMPGVSPSPEYLNELRDLLREHTGQTPVQLHIGTTALRLPDEFNVDIDRVMGRLRASYGDSVYIG